MSQAMSNTILYQKMFAEQELFKAELMLLSSAEVLDRAYEYVCREDILIAMEYTDLPSRQALALLKSPISLADIFQKWDSWDETLHMEHIWNAVKARANEVVRANFIEARRDAR